MDDAIASNSPGSQPAKPAVPILSYATSGSSGTTVIVGQYANAFEAEMHSARLADEGIPNNVLNANVNALGSYLGFNAVGLQVHEADAERAKEILNSSAEDWEPAEERPDAPSIIDEEGRVLQLASAGAFASMRELREAQALLASSRIRSFPPPLVKRGDRPRGEGKRFILRVAEEDMERAVALIDEAEDEDNEDTDPRCPRCKSWRIHPVPRFWKSFLAFWGIGKWPPREAQCAACQFRAEVSAFAKQ